MRILYLGLIIALTVLVGFFGFQAYALWVPLSTQQLLEQSKTIFVGNITAVTPVEVQYQSQIARNGTVKQSVGPETMTLDEYTVHVEEFLQNPQGYDTIKLRQATVGGVPSGPSAIGGFEVGDRVMFFLPKYENQTRFPMQYLPESFKIPQFCNGQDVLAQKRIVGSNNFTVIQNGLKVDYGNFTVDKPIKFLYDKDMNTLFGKRFDVAVGISKANDGGNLAVFSQEIHAGTKPCQWVTSAAWEFTPKEDGKYIMTIITKEGNETGGMSQTPFYVKSDSSVINHKLPLKQFKSGTPAGNVKCNDGLQLIIKAEDGTPACVTPDTAQILVQREWAKIIVARPNPASNIGNKTSSLQIHLSTNSTSIQQGHAIGIDVWLNNTSTGTLIIKSQNDWPMKGLTWRPCVGMPFGIALYDGYYSQENVTQGQSLTMFPDRVIHCNVYRDDNRQGTTYIFQPLSDIALLENTSGNFSDEIHDNFWLPSFNDNIIFEPGTYTIVAGDEWGHLVIQHFAVTNTTQS